MRQMMHILLITRLAEVVIVTHCTSVAPSLKVPLGAPVTDALMRGGAVCWWSRGRRSRCRANRCAAQAVDEQTQERLALAFGVPRTFIARTYAILSRTVHTMLRTQDGACKRECIILVKPRGLEEHHYIDILCPSSDKDILLERDDITCDRNIAELVLGGPGDDRAIIVPEEDLVDDFVGA